MKHLLNFKEFDLSEKMNYIYDDSDYERYINMELDIVAKLRDLYPQKEYMKSTWYRRSHPNDKDLIFKLMYIVPQKTNHNLSKEDKINIKNVIKDILNKYNIKNANIKIDNEGYIDLSNFKDNKIKTRDKGRESFMYPIQGREIKFIIADRDLTPFVGVNTLSNIFNKNQSLSIDGSLNIVSRLGTHVNRYIKIYDDIFLLSDVEKSYVKYFQDTIEPETQENISVSDVLFKRYILNDLKTFNNDKELVDLFDMLETTNFNFVFYDSIETFKNENYVRKI